MPDADRWSAYLGTVAVAAPAALVLALGIPALLGRRLKEGTVVRAVRVAIGVGLVACLAVLGLMPFAGPGPAIVERSSSAGPRCACAALGHGAPSLGPWRSSGGWRRPAG